MTGIFLDSFDTVRFESSERRAGTKAEFQAEVETAICLLFGRIVDVSEPISFDSWGFLRCFPKVVDARQRVATKLRRRSTDANLPMPFRLKLRKRHSSYRDMLASMIGNVGDTDDARFVLSSCVHLDRDRDARTRIAEAIRNSNWEKGVHDFRSANDGNDEMIRLVERIDRDYFGDLERYGNPSEAVGAAGMPHFGTLQAYCDTLFKEPPQEMEGDLCFTWERLRKACHALRSEDVDLDKRSAVFSAANRFLDSETARLFREFTSSCYNAVIADAVRAHGMFGTTSEAKLDADLVASQNASEVVQQMVRRDDYQNLVAGSLDMQTSERSKHFENVLDNNSKLIDWDEIWHVLADNQWRESIEALGRSKDSVEWRAKFEEHCKYLDQQLGQWSYEAATANSKKKSIKFVGQRVIEYFVGIPVVSGFASWFGSKGVDMIFSGATLSTGRYKIIRGNADLP